MDGSRQQSRGSLRNGESGVAGIAGGSHIPINEIFDILPLSGYLEPGQNENVEFVFNAFTGNSIKTTAVCHVEGGPNYEVTLMGNSSLIDYTLSSNKIDFG